MYTRLYIYKSFVLWDLKYEYDKYNNDNYYNSR